MRTVIRSVIGSVIGPVLKVGSISSGSIGGGGGEPSGPILPITTDGLLLYYDLSSLSGDSIDSVGNTRGISSDGLGEYELTTAELGTVPLSATLGFSGVPYVTIDDTSNDGVVEITNFAPEGQTEFTCMVWARHELSLVDGDDNLYAQYAVRDIPTGSFEQNRIWRTFLRNISNENQLIFAQWDSNQLNTIDYNVDISSLDITEWHLYTTVFDEGVCKLYVDGVELSGTDLTGNPYSPMYVAGSQPPLCFGAYQARPGGDPEGFQERWDGDLAGGRYYDRALSDSEILDIYNNFSFGPADTLSSCIGYWPMNDGSGNFATDAISSNDGKLGGPASGTGGVSWNTTGHSNFSNLIGVTGLDEYSIVTLNDELSSAMAALPELSAFDYEIDFNNLSSVNDQEFTRYSDSLTSIEGYALYTTALTGDELNDANEWIGMTRIFAKSNITFELQGGYPDVTTSYTLLDTVNYNEGEKAYTLEAGFNATNNVINTSLSTATGTVDHDGVSFDVNPTSAGDLYIDITVAAV